MLPGMSSPLTPPSELQRLDDAVHKLSRSASLLRDEDAVERFHLQPGTRSRTLGVIRDHVNDALAEARKLSGSSTTTTAATSPSLDVLLEQLDECGRHYDVLRVDWPSEAAPRAAKLEEVLARAVSITEALRSAP
ncbi:MAG: hypothetical protein RLN75_08075 [Longimicrobiales bacterium]